jgi:tetratricopeptide (TPR) repeat protein
VAVDTADGLTGREVAVTGRLASMTHDEAQRRIAAAGGRWVAEPRAGTAFLVVGEEGWPLRDDGQLTRALQEAERLQRRGAGPRILAEHEFLALLGANADPGVHRLYTTAQIARMLDVPQPRLRAWMRSGLIAPVRTQRRLCFFDFAQVASAKALCALSARGASAARVRRSLEQLRGWLPQAERALPQLEAIERGGPLLVRLADGRLAEPSGQLRLDFAAPAEERAPDAHAPAPRTLEQWFERGIAAEEAGRLEEAAAAYHEAMLAGGPQPEICFNLGNTLFALGRTAEAVQRFAQATELDRDYVEAWNNLGNTLAEIGRTDEAVRAYRRALAIEPHYADAHYNLAQTLASAGDRAGAGEHWRAFLAHDPNSAWAREVREQLASLEHGPAC